MKTISTSISKVLDWSEIDPRLRSKLRKASELVAEVSRVSPHSDILDVWATVTHGMRNPLFLPNFARAGNVSSAGEEVLNKAIRVKSNHSSPSTFTFIDLFAGIGGFHLAAELACREQNKRSPIPMFVSEWNTASRQTYAGNFGIVPFGDIRKVTRSSNGNPRRSLVSKMVPYADLITGGFPCQPFSSAGVASRNFHGLPHGISCQTQGTLFEDILILATRIKPKVLLLENVSNLPRHDGGRTLRVILEAIESCGYSIFPKRTTTSKQNSWTIVDSSVMVPQRRRRVFLVCIRNDLVEQSGNFVFPNFDLLKRPENLWETLRRDDQTEEQKFGKYSISQRLWDSHQRREQRHIENGSGFRIGRIDERSDLAPTLVARYYKDGKDALVLNPKSPLLPPRMLTPRECALLQGFPESFVVHPAKTHAYRQFGNAITPPIAAHIIQELLIQKFL